MTIEELREVFSRAYGAGLDTEDILHALADTLQLKAKMEQNHACGAETVAATEATRKAVLDCAYGLHNKRADAIRTARRRSGDY